MLQILNFGAGEFVDLTLKKAKMCCRALKSEPKHFNVNEKLVNLTMRAGGFVGLRLKKGFFFFFKLKIAIFWLFSIMAQFGCLVSDGEP